MLLLYNLLYNKQVIPLPSFPLSPCLLLKILSILLSSLTLCILCQKQQVKGSSLASSLNGSQLLDCTRINSIDQFDVGNGCSREAILNSSQSKATKEISDNYGLSNQLFKTEKKVIRRQRGLDLVGDESACSNQQQQQDFNPSVVCSPTNSSTKDDEKQTAAQKSPIQVYIRTPNNETQFVLGSALTIECRFITTTLNQNLKFKLRWLRSVIGSEGNNQSITNTDTEDASMTIIAATTRVWTVQRNGGLDLELNDFQESDAGDYFCQAESESSKILDGAQVHLRPLRTSSSLSSADDASAPLPLSGPHANSSSEAIHGSAADQKHGKSSILLNNNYSQENLSKLLPSLKVVPEFSEVTLGETVQLICITSELDPDPEPNEIIWSFESIDRSRDPMLGAGLSQSKPTVEHNKHFSSGSDNYALPTNSTVLGNVLIIWSMLPEYSGLYKCTVNLNDFNLTIQASGELSLRPTSDSAPLVFVSPELIRLPPNSSATIQCEATGYPPPEINWYRVDGTNFMIGPEANNSSVQVTATISSQPDEMLSNIDGLEFEQIAYQDSVAYCKRNKCFHQNQTKHHYSSSSSNNKDNEERITRISLVHLHKARAQHQGQYVCRANNKHGSNQASSIVDVEFKEPPIVGIAKEFREQTIMLPAGSSGEDDDQQQQQKVANVTFKCTIESGRPQPRLRWLRTTHANQRIVNIDNGGGKNNLDIYDLTKVSSATSNVSTYYEDFGKTFVLVISTISLDDEGDYICLGENEWGRHSALGHLFVRKPVSIRIPQPSPLLARINDSFHLDCLVSGYPLPIDIEWSRSDKGGAFFSLISRSNSLILSNQNSSLTQPSNGHQERAILKFDRVSQEESGEYTCNARDPLNSSLILRDTIMVVVEDENLKWMDGSNSQSSRSAALLPKLMVRPTKTNAQIGSNVTLDCLAVSGLQPTIVEWIAPPPSVNNGSADSRLPYTIKPYYRSGAGVQSPASSFTGGQMFQFGSKLKILNVSKAHEGVYQCKGSNKIGVEIAPALIKVLDLDSSGSWMSKKGSSTPSISPSAAQPDNEDDNQDLNQSTQIKTKVARFGSNIELKCQVNGVEQPATSWSREGKELPRSSVQIGHNLWIQNVTQKDDGLYICSARSKQPNKVIQAKINLLVQGQLVASDGRTYLDSISQQLNLAAKIVASRGQVNVGDSITLECIISQQQSNQNQSSRQVVSVDLDDIERNVVWTNSHSGQSLFQDNVYIQNNLLIIYELRPENSATYRCNYNDLLQHTDYKLQVQSSSGEATNQNQQQQQQATTEMTQSSWVIGNKQQQVDKASDTTNKTYLIASNGRRAELMQVSSGSRVKLECPLLSLLETAADTTLSYYWTKGSGDYSQLIGGGGGDGKSFHSVPLVFESIKTSDADIYHCHLLPSSSAAGATTVLEPQSILLHVLVPIARFVQRPVSFVTLPTISGADQQLEIELKFLPERDYGLILFNGQQTTSATVIATTTTTTNRSSSSSSGNTNSSSGGGDFISLGLNRGYLELKFELGDGTTLLRSAQSVTLNQWHKVLIERNRRGAIMWLDKQTPVANSSTGKFFNLNLDSVLYVGGHQHFLTSNGKAAVAANGRATKQQQSLGFYGYLRGFQGCISYLRISKQEINLMARNRSVALGVFECDKQECKQQEQCGPTQNSVCQIDHQHRSQAADDIWSLSQAIVGGRRMLPTFVTQVSELRCICLPGFVGDRCDSQSWPLMTKNELLQQNKPPKSGIQQTTSKPAAVTLSGACELLSPCSPNGTLKCQSLTSTSYKCHCQLGFIGQTCAQTAQFSSETSVWFNQQAYLQFRFNKPEEAQAIYLQHHHQQQQRPLSASATKEGGDSIKIGFNSSLFGRLTQMAENQNISFKLQTKSSYGLIFYIGQAAPVLDNSTNPNNSGDREINNNFSNSVNYNHQTSKSVIANLLSRLSNIVLDYLAIALVDGHVELSYELGSGVAIIRSSQRVNDNLEHKISIIRQGKVAKLIIDDKHKHEGQSPGKLSMLNSQPDIYLGGLPHLAELTNNMYMSGFTGCLSELELNSLGPLNLIRSDHLTRVRSARNLAPCHPPLQSSLSSSSSSPPSSPSSSSATATANSSSSSSDLWPPLAQSSSTIATTTTTTVSPIPTTTTAAGRHKPYQEPPKADSDDPDDM